MWRRYLLGGIAVPTNMMRSFTMRGVPSRSLRAGSAATLAMIALTSGTVLRAQSTLPAIMPTALATAQPSQMVAPLNGTAPIKDAASRVHRAEIRYTDGLLSVNANNSSLNSILRDIGRQTGMTITGGVTDERVFGHYGPATPANILLTLLDGTGVNVLVRQNDADSPLELIMTPRNGAATPPNPNAPGYEDVPPDADEQPQPVAQPTPQPVAQPIAQPVATQPAPAIGVPGVAQAPLPAPASTTSAVPSIPLPANNINGSSANVTPTASQLPTTNSVPLDTLATPSTTPASAGIVDTPNPPAADVVNPVQKNAEAIGTAAAQGQPVSAPAGGATLPAGATTPEQIFEQLQKMRQQQQQSGSTTTPASAPAPTPTTPAPQ